MPATIHGEEILGKRCSIAFQISPKLQQTCHGRVTKYMYEGALAVAGEESIIHHRQYVAFDNGDEKWLDLEREAAEGRLQWLPDPPVAKDVARGVPKESEEKVQPSPSKKQKNDAGGPLAGNSLTEALCLNSGMLKDVLPTIVAFVDPSDRNSMVLVNSHLRDAVEVHSKNMLTKITKDHAVDDTFENRIQDQTRIRTTQTKPVDLPYRYLLTAAKKTPLYTVVAPTEFPYTHPYGGFALDPSRTRLFFVYLAIIPERAPARRASVQIYDLPTKRCTQNFFFEMSFEGGLKEVYSFDNLVVVHTVCVIRVFTEAGKLLHQFRKQRGDRDLECIRSSTRQENILFLLLSDSVVSFDIRSGASNKIIGFENTDYDKFRHIKGACFGRWLVVGGGKRNLRFGAISCTDVIRVYDLSNDCCENHWLEGHYLEVKQCSENPSIFYALPYWRNREDGAHVLELSAEGKLSRISTFPISSSLSLLCSFRHCVFSKERSDASRVHLLNTMNGKVEGSLVLKGCQIDSIVPNGPEMLVGNFSLSAGAPSIATREFISIAAFLSDPFL